MGTGSATFLDQSGSGNTIDFSALPDQLIVASNAGAYAGAISEHVLAMTLSIAKRLPQRHAALAAGRYDKWAPSLTLDGATITGGIVTDTGTVNVDANDTLTLSGVALTGGKYADLHAQFNRELRAGLHLAIGCPLHEFDEFDFGRIGALAQADTFGLVGLPP